MKKILAVAMLLVIVFACNAYACDSLDGCLSQIPIVAEPGEGMGKEECSLAVEIQKYGKDAIPGLLKYLESDNHDIRKLAAYTLGGVDGLTEDNLPVLIKAHKAGTGWIDFAIASVGTDNAARFLVGEMKKEWGISAVATGALSRLGYKAVPYLLEDYSCSQDCNELHMRLIGDMFGELGADAVTAVPELVTIASDRGKSLIVRKGALYALQKIGGHASDAVTGLTVIAGDASQDESLRLDAIRAIGSIGEAAKSSLQTLRAIANSNSDKLAVAAKDAIVGIGGNDSLQVLIQQLDDPQKSIDAFWRIAFMGQEASSAVPAVEAKLKSQDHYDRVYAAHTLGFIGNQASVSALCGVLDLDSDWMEVAVACESLGMLNAKSAIPELEKIRDNYWYPSTRNEADKAIRVIRGIDSYPPVETDEQSFFWKYMPYWSKKYRLDSCEPIDYPLAPIISSQKFYKKDNEELAKGFIYKINQTNYAYTDLDGTEHPRWDELVEMTPTVGLNVGNGWLLGRNYGEFGGEMVFWESKEKYTIISEENIEDIFWTSDGIIAVAGISHMSLDNNFLYKVDRQADGAWKPIIYKYLSGYTRESSMLADGRILRKNAEGNNTILS
ncbi:MAG: HEAT repeat domain-containing protein [Nitrospirae bacterium]|nr:HEAT repeat domain-containing protein [Nitrospirota bacterium]